VKYHSRLWESGIRLVYADMRLANTINVTKADWLHHTKQTLDKYGVSFSADGCNDVVLQGISSLITRVAMAVEDNPNTYHLKGHNDLIFQGLQAS